jgi:hypothetical protein
MLLSSVNQYKDIEKKACDDQISSRIEHGRQAIITLYIC